MGFFVHFHASFKLEADILNGVSAFPNRNGGTTVYSTMVKQHSMKLVNFDPTVAKTLSDNGYTHAVIQPLSGDKSPATEDESNMVVVPFHDFGEASYHLDTLDEASIYQSIIVEMDSKLAQRTETRESKIHLFIDVDSVDLRRAS